MTQAISGVRSYLELRKSIKDYMREPKHITVRSITTEEDQELWIGGEKYEEFVGKKLCFIDDVVSTGGTVDSVLAMAKEIGFEVSVIACVLTEGEENGIQGHPAGFARPYPSSRGHRLRLRQSRKDESARISEIWVRHFLRT